MQTQASPVSPEPTIAQQIELAKVQPTSSFWKEMKDAGATSLKVAAYVAPAVLIVGLAYAAVSWVSPKSD